MLPPLLSGLVLGGWLILPAAHWEMNVPMALVWLLFYGCALHSAGFFMVRGIKWFGWGYIIVSILLTVFISAATGVVGPSTGNWIMGLLFGGLHLAYGGYLYFTEQKSSAV
jgi:hypothetical protein